MIDTRKLEAFAADARVQLITEVTAKVNAVLAPASTARIEFPDTIKALEADVRRHGGDSKGRQHVAEQQAYVWFNRIIAFRFMDANNYTTTPVVSPGGDREVGQPATLTAAKRGEFDSDVYTNGRVVQRITGLLNGTIPSQDRDGEAYGLILNTHCAYWNKAMPFMFQPEGDYTELLMPSGLLAETSVLSQAVRTITAEDCQDVEIIGWLYQYYISEKKAQVFDSFSRGAKAGPDEIPAATQLFTPDWIVRYLVQNSVGRLWLLNHPQSRLAEQMEYYIAPDGDPGEFLKITSPEELTVLDPACGSGHMLTYAFDLLYAIYEEEGYPPSQIPELILTNNLHGLEIDGRSGALAAFALTMKARSRQRRFFTNRTEPNVCVLLPISFASQEMDELITKEADRDTETDFWNTFTNADTFGSLLEVDSRTLEKATKALSQCEPTTIDGSATMEHAVQAVGQAEYLARQYAVLVGNPPYMGSGRFSELMRFALTGRFKITRTDLYALFLERCLGMVQRSGFLAMVTMQGWMFTTSYKGLREFLLDSTTIVTLAQFGARAFETISGEIVSTAAFVLCATVPAPDAAGAYLRLVGGDACIKERGLHTQSGLVRCSQQVMRDLPSSPLVYWEADLLARIYREFPAIGDTAPVREGLHTGDNYQFLRMWWEAGFNRVSFDSCSRESLYSSGARWVPYNKGGTATRWYGNNLWIVAFDRASRARMSELSGFVEPSKSLYFQAGGTWSDVGTTGLRVKYYPNGYLFDAKGPVVIGGDDNLFLIGAMNSSSFAYLGELLMPTISYKAGTVKRIPLPDVSDKALVKHSVAQAIDLVRSAWDETELSWDFRASVLASTMRRARMIETEIEAFATTAQIRQRQLNELESANNALFASLYGLDEANAAGELGFEATELSSVGPEDAVKDFISYAVSCMFGRYSLDEPGLILASQGETLADYLKRVPTPSFTPDSDNVIPVTDDEWFEDDIVARFRQFLRVSLGDEHFAENLAFIEQTLGKSLRAYFLKDFYVDHVKRYKNRPIYWMFSSSGDAKGAFKALVYLHRYTPATLHTLLTNYLREFQAKLRAEITSLERSGGNAELKKADALRKSLTECEDYERDVLFPLATQNLDMDLDDGVLVNYLRFGKALVKIKSIEDKRKTVEGWTWPKNPLKPEGGAR